MNPQRIVSDYYLGEFLAVDVKPVIASPYALNNPYLDGLTDGIEPMNITSAETTLEQFTAAKPDLIVTITEADYDKYSKLRRPFTFRTASAAMKIHSATLPIL